MKSERDTNPMLCHESRGYLIHYCSKSLAQWKNGTWVRMDFFFFFPLFESDVIYVRKEISIGVYWEKELFKGHKKGMGKSFTG